MMTRLLRCCAALLITALLAACEDGRVDVTLSADRPATSLQQVVVTVEGISLVRADSSEDRIDLDKPVLINLMNQDTTAVSLLNGEALDSGDYTGIRLRLVDSANDNNDNYVVDASGTRRALTISDIDALAPLLFTVKKNGGKTYTLQLRMDLRSSLSADGDSRSLKPLLRAARSTKAASVSGSVTNSIVTGNSCKGSRAAGVGVAVYAFAGHDITPDDADGLEPDPIATAPVLGSSSSGWTYRIGTLPPGDYTLALTCNGDIEDGVHDDDIEFIGDKQEINLDDADDKDLDFKN